LILLKDRTMAALFSLFLILGTNYLHLALWGVVWYLAQNMAFAFTLMAFYFALSDKKWHGWVSLLALCMAMGCRPFNGLYAPLVCYLLWRREKLPFLYFAKKLMVYAVPALVLGLFFLWLNYARFGSIFEFGHNYLPEFTIDPHGQFHTNRIGRNLRMMFLDVDIMYGIRHGFPFVGRTSFAFWLASPILVSYAVYWGVQWFVGRKKDMTVWLVPLLVALHLFAFSFHRTLGGRQFGSRYAADALPAIYLGLLFILQSIKRTQKVWLNLFPMLFGLLINFYGTIQFFIFYFG